MSFRAIFYPCLLIVLAIPSAFGQSPTSSMNWSAWPTGTALTPPLPPALHVHRTPTGEISLNWTEVSKVEGYKVLRSTNGSTFTEIGAGQGDLVPTFLDKNRFSRGYRFYKVTVSNAAGSTDSNTAQIGPPTSLMYSLNNPDPIKPSVKAVKIIPKKKSPAKRRVR
jgi:hypothetical protein